MKKLIVAVDCDDVLLPSLDLVVNLYNHQFGTNVPLASAYDGSDKEWGAAPDEIVRRIYDIQLGQDYVKKAVPFDDAIKVCHKLARHHELHLITARPDILSPVTHGMLKTYFSDVFSTVKHVGEYGDKGNVCQYLLADVLIDDNERHLVAAERCGVEHLLRFGDYPWQKDMSQVAVACRNWYEVEAEIERIAAA